MAELTKNSEKCENGENGEKCYVVVYTSFGHDGPDNGIEIRKIYRSWSHACDYILGATKNDDDEGTDPAEKVQVLKDQGYLQYVYNDHGYRFNILEKAIE